jgi:hypothetical protein
LRFQEATIDPEAAQGIALALAPNGALLPKEEGPWVMRTTVWPATGFTDTWLRAMMLNEVEYEEAEV